MMFLHLTINMQNGNIITIKKSLLKPGVLSNKILSHGLYRAFILENIPSKSYSIEKSRWISADGLYLVVEDTNTLNIENHVYFNVFKILDPNVGQLVYINKEHFCIAGEDNE